jgi:hypothetical protein
LTSTYTTRWALKSRRFFSRSRACVRRGSGTGGRWRSVAVVRRVLLRADAHPSQHRRSGTYTRSLDRGLRNFPQGVCGCRPMGG